MTPLHATAQHIRSFAPAGGHDLAMPAAHASKAVQRAQPVEYIHKPIFRTQGRQAPRGRVRRPGQEVAVAGPTPARWEPHISSERLSPVAKFGDSAPTWRTSLPMIAAFSAPICRTKCAPFRAICRAKPIKPRWTDRPFS